MNNENHDNSCVIYLHRLCYFKLFHYYTTLVTLPYYGLDCSFGKWKKLIFLKIKDNIFLLITWIFLDGIQDGILCVLPANREVPLSMPLNNRKYPIVKTAKSSM